MHRRSASLLAAMLALGVAAPASASIIGISPDPATVTDPYSSTEAQIEFLDATVGALPTGGTLLDGTIGAGDDVISLRFTNTGGTTWTLVANIPIDATLTAVGVSGGVAATDGGAQPDFGGIVAAVPMGGFIDVFFALAGVGPGSGLHVGAYGPLTPAEGDVSLLVPEPSLLALALAGGALIGLRRTCGLRSDGGRQLRS